MKPTYSVKPNEIIRSWYIIDAQEAPLGRIATTVASLLMGKQKTQFSKHIDCGDYVIIINASKTNVTGDKLLQKKYVRHSGYPGGITIKKLSEKMTENPADVMQKAIRGMLPVNKLRPARLARLKIYTTQQHEHSAQKPIKLKIRGDK